MFDSRESYMPDELKLINVGYYSVKGQPGVMTAQMRLNAYPNFGISVGEEGAPEQPNTVNLSSRQAQTLAEFLARHLGQRLVSA
jgi:hypothetical protein